MLEYEGPWQGGGMARRKPPRMGTVRSHTSGRQPPDPPTRWREMAP